MEFKLKAKVNLSREVTVDAETLNEAFEKAQVLLEESVEPYEQDIVGVEWDMTVPSIREYNIQMSRKMNHGDS